MTYNYLLSSTAHSYLGPAPGHHVPLFTFQETSSLSHDQKIRNRLTARRHRMKQKRVRQEDTNNAETNTIEASAEVTQAQSKFLQMLENTVSTHSNVQIFREFFLYVKKIAGWPNFLHRIIIFFLKDMYDKTGMVSNDI